MWLQGIAKRHNWNSFVSNRPYIVHKCTFNNCIFLKWISQKWFFKHFFQRFAKRYYWNCSKNIQYLILGCFVVVCLLLFHLFLSMCPFVYLLVWWIVCLLVCLSNLLLSNLSGRHILGFFSRVFIFSCCPLWWLGCLKCQSHIKTAFSVSYFQRGLLIALLFSASIWETHDLSCSRWEIGKLRALSKKFKRTYWSQKQWICGYFEWMASWTWLNKPQCSWKIGKLMTSAINANMHHNLGNHMKTLWKEVGFYSLCIRGNKKRQ